MNNILEHGFYGASLKVERAYRHIHELQLIMKNLSGKPANALTIAKQPDGMHTVTFTSLGDEGRFLPLIVGDAIHNLRVACDHLWLALHRTTSDNGKPSFPFHKTRENVIDAVTKSPVKTAFPKVERLIINEIKPHRDLGGNEVLWAITHFDNIDKHNLIIPTIQSHLVTGMEIGGNTYSNITFTDVNTPFGFDRPIEHQNQGNIALEITFPEGDVLSGQPIIPTLVNMAQATGQVVKLFRDEFL